MNRKLCTFLVLICENCLTEFRELISGHWKAFSLIVVAVSALVTGVYAYWKNSTPSNSSPASSTVTSYPLELRVELNKTEFQRGESINPYLYLKNLSNRTVRIFGSQGLFDFKVTDEGGTVIYRLRNYLYQFIPAAPDILKPYEELNVTIYETLVPNKSLDSPGVPLQISKGTYKIIGLTLPIEVAYLDPWELIGASVVLETPPITMTIT